jgi:hypothetical protein
MFNCLVCGTEKPLDKLHVIKLTEAERQFLDEDREQYTYCQPCWKILSNPVTAPALMSGIARHRLQQAGVDQADQLAQRYYQSLTKLATTRRS